MKVSAIVAVDQGWGIGKGGGLLVRDSVDMAFFSGFTQGKVVIVGHNSYNDVKELKNRYVIKDDHKVDVSIFLNDVFSKNLEEIVVIGGGKTYKRFAEMVDELYITRFNSLDVSADTHFPVNDYSHLRDREVILKKDNFSIEVWKYAPGEFTLS